MWILVVKGLKQAIEAHTANYLVVLSVWKFVLGNNYKRNVFLCIIKITENLVLLLNNIVVKFIFSLKTLDC